MRCVTGLIRNLTIAFALFAVYVFPVNADQFNEEIVEANKELSKVLAQLENYKLTDQKNTYRFQDDSIKSLIDSSLTAMDQGLYSLCFENLSQALALSQGETSTKYSALYTNSALCALRSGKTEQAIKLIGNNLKGFISLDPDLAQKNLELLLTASQSIYKKEAEAVLNDLAKMLRLEEMNEILATILLKISVELQSKTLYKKISSRDVFKSSQGRIALAQAKLFNKEIEEALMILGGPNFSDDEVNQKAANILKAKAYGLRGEFSKSQNYFNLAGSFETFDLDTKRDAVYTELRLGIVPDSSTVISKVESYQSTFSKQNGVRDWDMDRDVGRFCLRIKNYNLVQKYLSYLRNTFEESNKAFTEFKSNPIEQSLSIIASMSIFKDNIITSHLNQSFQSLEKLEMQNFDHRKKLALTVEKNTGLDFLTRVPSLTHVEQKILRSRTELVSLGKKVIRDLEKRLSAKLSPKEKLQISETLKNLSDRETPLDSWSSKLDNWKSRSQVVGIQHRFESIKQIISTLISQIQYLNWLSNSSKSLSKEALSNNYTRLDRLLNKLTELSMSVESSWLRSQLLVYEIERTSVAALTDFRNFSTHFTDIEEALSILGPYINNSLDPSNAVLAQTYQEFLSKWNTTHQKLWAWSTGEYDGYKKSMSLLIKKINKSTDHLYSTRKDLARTRLQINKNFRNLAPRISSQLEAKLGQMSQDLMELNALSRLEKSTDSRKSALEFEDLQSYRNDSLRKGL